MARESIPTIFANYRTITTPEAEDPGMIVFLLNISCDNAALTGEDRRPEVARILRAVAARLEDGEDFLTFQTLRDSNGNDVGRAAFKARS